MREHARGELLEILLGARVGEPDVAQVVVEVEGGVIDPDRVLLDRDPLESLAEPRDPVQERLDGAVNRRDVEAPVPGLKRARVEDRGAARVGERNGGFEDEERGVLCGQSLVVVAGRASFSSWSGVMR